jgi:hypothetical protein
MAPLWDDEVDVVVVGYVAAVITGVLLPNQK